MATHFGILGWRIPWTEEPGMLQLWCCKELDTAVGLSMHTCIYTHTWSDIKVIYIGMNKMKYKSWKNYMANMNCYGVDILERGLIRDVPEKMDRISIDGVNEEAGLK